MGSSPHRILSSQPVRALDDRYQLDEGRVYLSGVQALVRLPFDQARRDSKAGLRTGFFISGYPGSPLGGYDLALQSVRHIAGPLGIVHQPGQNEELAATAITGTQMLSKYPSQRYDGVVGIWYGKGPGMDRSGDAFRHGNYMGTTAHGAVVVLSGEDHEAKSSTLPVQQEYAFVHSGIPLLYPSSVREFLEYGLHAVALSRFSGCWAGMKLVAELCDGGETFEVSQRLPEIRVPELDFEKYQYFRFFPVETNEYERRLYEERHPAVVAYARANGLDRVVTRSGKDRIGILTAGKAYADTLQALTDLGVGERELNAAGIRLIKLGLIYPADRDFIRDAVEGLEELLVVEEKRGFIEERVKEAVANSPSMPRIFGKSDESGRVLFPLYGAMDPDVIAERIGPRLRNRLRDHDLLDLRLREITVVREREYGELRRRMPNYCSGCPHNVSTRLLEGQEAWGAPGCHVFATIIEQPERHIDVVTQLGGEGLPWIGLAPFTDRHHIFQNMGDGGMWHSGYQNIRFAVAAGVTMTYKILFNGSIANTGAQASVGAKDVPTLAAMLALDGVRKIAIIAKDPGDYRHSRLPAIARVHPVEEYDDVVRDLERTDGVTIFLYDGECANERRRKQKRGLRPKPQRFAVINEDVCENCGHCGSLTNCMSLQKVDTWAGQKTQVHQGSCNQDLSCLGGDCPSFMTVDVRPGTGLRKPSLVELESGVAPEPRRPSLERPYHVYLPGVGGTGVLTVNAILGWAALLDGLEVMSYDQTGAAQKWGAVLSSIVVARPGARTPANKVGRAKADLYLAFDLMAASDRSNLDRCDPKRTAAVINSTLLPSGEMVRDVEAQAPIAPMIEAIGRFTDPARTVTVEARSLAEMLFGDYMAANLFVLGSAYQAGLLPISALSIEEAIALNGVSVQQNVQAFRYGRLHYFEPNRVRGQTGRGDPLDATAAELRKHRVSELHAGFGKRAVGDYVDFCELIAERSGDDSELTRDVVRNLYKLMAYKDEYEVARLHLAAGGSTIAGRMFERPLKVTWLLHPPLLRSLGLKKKLRLGPWFRPVLWTLSKAHFLRGTPFDPFGHTAVRREERRLPSWYRNLILRALDEAPDRVGEIAKLPDLIRGYEEIKLRNIERAELRARILLNPKRLDVLQ